MSMAERMITPHFLGQGRIEFREKPVPTPGPGQLLIQVKANALCGSEKGQFYGGSDVTPGHEAAGIVTAAGPNTHISVGTPGVVFLMDFCGQCRSCRRGATNQCLAKRGDLGFSQDGGYGPFELIHESVFFPIDKSMDMAEATMLLDIMGTGGHALARGRLMVDELASIVIAGAGPIGLGTLAMAKLLLGNDIPVLISDVTPYRLKLAESLGGLAINLREETLAEGSRRHSLAGVDLALDTSGKGQARQDCLNLLNQRGALVCIGHGEGLQLEVSPDLIAPERAVLGSEYFRFDELPANLERLRLHRDYLSPIITHQFPVTEIQQAFELFFAGETGKVIVTHD